MQRKLMWVLLFAAAIMVTALDARPVLATPATGGFVGTTLAVGRFGEINVCNHLIPLARRTRLTGGKSIAGRVQRSRKAPAYGNSPDWKRNPTCEHTIDTLTRTLGLGRLAFARLDAVARAAVGHGRCLIEPVSRCTVGKQISMTRRARIPARQRFGVRLFEMPVTCSLPRDILANVVTLDTR